MRRWASTSAGPHRFTTTVSGRLSVRILARLIDVTVTLTHHRLLGVLRHRLYQSSCVHPMECSNEMAAQVCCIRTHEPRSDVSNLLDEHCLKRSDKRQSAAVAAIVRGYHSAINNGTRDPTYGLAVVTVWASIEFHFCMLGANFAFSGYIYYFVNERRRERSFRSTSTYQEHFLASRSGNWKSTGHSTRGFAEIDEQDPTFSRAGRAAVDVRTDVYVESTRATPRD